MTQDELQIARGVRRTMDKFSLDTNICSVTILKGRLYLGGQIKMLRSARNVDMKEEVEAMRRAIMRNCPQLKEIVMECRIVVPEAKPKPDHAAAPGQDPTEATNFGPPKEEQGNTHHMPGRHF